MSRAPHVRVMALLGFMAVVSAGCASTPPNAATSIPLTPVVEVATAAPIFPPTTFALASTPTILPTTLTLPTSIDATAISTTVIASPTLTTPSEPTATAATSAPSPAPAGDELENRTIDLINQNRIAVGCNIPMTRSPALTTAARNHSQDMATHNFFGHTGSDGSTRASRAQDAGYIIKAGERVRENIAAFARPVDVVNSWMQDPETRNQLLDCDYNDIGIGYAKIKNSPPNKYWTALFGVRP